MPSMKNTGKKYVTFLIISKQSHTRNLYFNYSALLTLYCILLQHINSLTFIMFILFIEMYLGCSYDVCIQLLYKRDTKCEAYAKLLNVHICIYISLNNKKIEIK